MSFGVRYRNRKKGRIFYKYTDFEDYPDSFLQILFREKQGSGPKRRGKTQSRFETCRPARKMHGNPVFAPKTRGCRDASPEIRRKATRSKSLSRTCFADYFAGYVAKDSFGPFFHLFFAAEAVPVAGDFSLKSAPVPIRKAVGISSGDRFGDLFTRIADGIRACPETVPDSFFGQFGQLGVGNDRRRGGAFGCLGCAE